MQCIVLWPEGATEAKRYVLYDGESAIKPEMLYGAKLLEYIEPMCIEAHLEAHV